MVHEWFNNYCHVCCSCSVDILSVVVALSVNHVFSINFHLLLHWCWTVNLRTVIKSSMLYPFLLILHVTYIFFWQRDMDFVCSSWVLMIVLHDDRTVEWMFYSVQYASDWTMQAMLMFLYFQNGQPPITEVLTSSGSAFHQHLLSVHFNQRLQLTTGHFILYQVNSLKQFPIKLL